MPGRLAAVAIETPRLTLRPPRMDDAEALAEAIGNYDVVRWLGSVPFPYRVEDARRFIAASRERSGRRWLIFHDSRLVGGIAIDGELGYWLARPAWGQGFATEAADAVIDVHFADPQAGPLESGHYLGNDRSAQVLRKLGFRDAGIVEREARVLGQMVQSRLMVLPRETWQARRRYRLDTARLTLRELRLGDWRGLWRIIEAPDLAHIGPPPAVPATRVAIESWIAAQRYRGRVPFAAAICTHGGRFLGTIGLRRACDDGAVTLGFSMKGNAVAEGFAHEAGAAFLADLHHRFALSGLTARCADENAAGRTVLRTLGFVETGRGLFTLASRLETAPNVNYRLTTGG